MGVRGGGLLDDEVGVVEEGVLCLRVIEGCGTKRRPFGCVALGGREGARVWIGVGFSDD
jgi:hypothetical protein